LARNRLSESRVSKLKPGIHSDGDGLFIRVHKTGSRNWVFIFKRDGKRTELGLGGFGRGTAPVNLALAREKADAVRQQLARGENPRAVEVAPVTFAEAMEALILVREKEWRNAKHADQWRMTLRTYAKPLHPMAVGTVTVDDVVRTLTPHWAARPETADRLRSRIAAVLDYAKARGLREGDNPARWRGLLENLLPARQKLSRGHHAAIDYNELPATVARLRRATGTSARAVEFAALTASRSGETRGAVWSEIDLKAALWIVPAERMKASVEHRVPLSARAVAILKAQKKTSINKLVFGGGVEGRPISDTAMTKALRAAAGDEAVTLHGLRSSFRDWAGDCTTHPRDICEAALAHVVQGVEAAYRRSDALAKRKVLMDDWADYLNTAKIN
ncbi:MAG TPA: integrase arm-type DNA-binding domain-containing protein, partial [Afipia sp.]